MDLRETPEQQALRSELRQYFADLLPPDERRAVGEAGAGGPRFREVVRMLGRDGWLGVGRLFRRGFEGRGASYRLLRQEQQRPQDAGTDHELKHTALAMRRAGSRADCPPRASLTGDDAIGGRCAYRGTCRTARMLRR